VVDLVRQDCVAREGALEELGETRERRVFVRLFKGSRMAFVTASGGPDPTALIQAGESIVRHQPEAEPLLPLADPLPEGFSVRHWCPTERLADFAARTTQSADSFRCEARSTQQQLAIEFGTTEGRAGSYATSRSALLFRATHHRNGRVGHAEWSDYAPSLCNLIETSGERVIRPARRHAKLLSAPKKRGRAVADVVLDAPVAARLVSLFAPALQADSVVQGRSRLSGMIGESVAARELHMTDDAMAPDVPWNAPFDDDGVATRSRELIADGVLRSYLADRRFASSVGMMPGCGWRSSDSAPPRARVSNALILPGSGIDLPDRALVVGQIHGFHTSNDVTGDFSVSASGRVEAGGNEYGVEGITLAGNIFEMLKDIRALGPEVRWASVGGGSIGAPSMHVAGLAVGW
jgi:PmbA protein